VIGWIKKSLASYGIRVNRITRVENCAVIRITDQKSVRLFAKKIGFSHSYHLGRYMQIAGHEGVRI
jgi:hypothetical protein